MTKKKTKKKCEVCRKRNGTTQQDPYRKKIWNEEVDITLCPKCLKERIEDI